MRILSEQQRTLMVGKLKGQDSDRVLITYISANHHSNMLALDFFDVLTEAGWRAEVEQPPTSYHLPWNNVKVGVRDCSDPNRGARLLLDALLEAGIETTGGLVGWRGDMENCYCLMEGSGG
jgi:hypothetical protein